MGFPELADDGSNTVHKAVRNRVTARSEIRSSICVDVWENECLDDLDLLVKMIVDEVDAEDYEEMSLHKAYFEVTKNPFPVMFQEGILAGTRSY